MMYKKSGCGTITHWLILIGALNWGLIGLGYLFGGYWNIIYLILGQWPLAENIVYIFIGMASLNALLKHRSVHMNNNKDMSGDNCH